MDFSLYMNNPIKIFLKQPGVNKRLLPFMIIYENGCIFFLYFYRL